jgi:Flp pilus assembly protein protease CpaA
MSMKLISNLVFWFVFSFFVAVKVAGTSFAAWSWWWMILPLIPVLSLLVTRLGL